jgi:phage I-like protein
MKSRILLEGVPLPEATPPTEFRIFKKGWNATSKGKFLFDDEAAKAVLKDYQEQGNELCLDYDHKAVDPDARAGDGRAAGWFHLEVRDDGLWAVNVRWTPPAREALANREWRYFSPAFMADAKTKRVVALINVALTNIPATKHMQPLVAAKKEDAPMKTAKKDKTMKAKEEEREEASDDEMDEDDDEEDETAAIVDEEEDDDEDDEHEEPDGDEPDGDEDEEDDEDEEEMAADAAEEDGEEDDEEDEPAPAKTKKKATRASVVAAARELTGKTRASDIIGTLRAYKHAREQVTVLSDRVRKLEKTLHEERVRKLVARGIRDGKITPALRKWARNLGRQDVAQLRAYLDQAAPMVSLGRATTAADAGGAIVTLTADELKVCELTGVSPGLFAKNKNNHGSSGRLS